MTFSAIFGGAVIGLGLVAFAHNGREVALGGGIATQSAVEATIWLLVTALFIVSYKRGAETLRLREKMLEGQELELAFREQALNAHSIAVTTDRKGKVIAVNENFTTTLGHVAAEIEGRSLASMLDHGEGKRADAALQQTSSGRVWNGDVKVLDKDGGVRILDATAVPMSDERGRHFKTVWLATDMTEQRVGEEEQQLIRCLELLPDEVFMIDPATCRIVYMNGTAVRRFGLDETENRSRAHKKASKDYGGELVRACRAHLSSAPDSTARFEVNCDGKIMEANLQNVETADHQKRCVVVLRDISERRQAEEIRRNFMMMMTHELRTPLTSIKGAIQLLTSGAAGNLEPGVQSMMHIAEKNSERLLRLVNDMLDFGKLEAGKMEFHMESVDVRALIDDAIESNRDYAAGLGVKLHADLAETPLHTHGDPGRLQQVLANLLSNAAKYSNEEDCVEIAADLVGEKVRISITDKGPGIPESARATLFDPFTQVGAHGNGKLNGTGLGLTIVKAIVESHGGSVDFRSETGKGTTFYIDLPVRTGMIRPRAA
ncbi:sensor histidine kinase [Roseovarius salis]|uniref:sensor histidine kinase n=1 Tax=Roseovarius salis TaxID=3376063 RepID=UPI0037C6E7CE